MVSKLEMRVTKEFICIILFELIYKFWKNYRERECNICMRCANICKSVCLHLTCAAKHCVWLCFQHALTDGGVLIAPNTAVDVSTTTVTKSVEFAYCQSASRVINTLHCVTKVIFVGNYEPENCMCVIEIIINLSVNWL